MDHGIPQFYALKDTPQLKSVSPQLYRASGAVIKLLDATAAFVCVGSTTYLMTNHHVLGAHNCPKSGCYGHAEYAFERDGPSYSKLLHLKPVAASADADIAFYAFTPSSASRACLSLAKAAPDASTPITLIGHPRGSLKKYSRGHIIEQWAGFIHVSAFSLPGSSGSPIVNGRGELVGIHHSSIKRNDMFTKTEIIYRGRGSSLKTIRQVLASKDLTGFKSITNPVSFAEAKAHTKLYQQARIKPQLDSTSSTPHFFKRLATACASALKAKPVPTQITRKTFRASVSACTIARDWIDCSPPHQPAAPPPAYAATSQAVAQQLHAQQDPAPIFRICPTASLRTQWRRLFMQVAHSLKAYYGDDEFGWWLKAHALSQTPGTRHWLRGITAELTPPSQHPIRPRVLSYFGQIIRKAGSQLPASTLHRLVHAVKTYPTMPGYSWHLNLIAQTTFDLYAGGHLDKATFDTIISRLAKETKSTVNTLLLIDKLTHQAGKLDPRQAGQLQL